MTTNILTGRSDLDLWLPKSVCKFIISRGYFFFLSPNLNKFLLAFLGYHLRYGVDRQPGNIMSSAITIAVLRHSNTHVICKIKNWYNDQIQLKNALLAFQWKKYFYQALAQYFCCACMVSSGSLTCCGLEFPICCSSQESVTVNMTSRFLIWNKWCIYSKLLFPHCL